MKEMSKYFEAGVGVSSFYDLCVAEIDEHLHQLPLYSDHDWPVLEKEQVVSSLNMEKVCISEVINSSQQTDSVKGESAMLTVYNYTGKATDIITLKSDLHLTELKYLIKKGGLGPFGGPSSFRARISDKFLNMGERLLSDEERVNSLRILVVTESQFPFSLGHIHGLLNSGYPAGTFSSDHKKYRYMLCTSRSLRMFFEGTIRSQDDVDCFYFTI